MATTDRDWVVGEVVTAAMMNAQVRDRVNERALFISGTYTGDGTAPRTIVLPFQPREGRVVEISGAGTSGADARHFLPIMDDDSSLMAAIILQRAEPIAINAFYPRFTANGLVVGGSSNESGIAYRYALVG